MKLIGKISINGTIETQTGLHIGGNKSSLEIGGVDLNVIKTGRGVPYIPGSSLKGKLRSLLAKVRGYESADKDDNKLKSLFGDSGANDNRGTTRLFVRDAHLDEASFEKTFGVKGSRNMDFDFSEVKTENTIDRSRGTAQHPRQIERVPTETLFNFEIIIDVYDNDNAVENLTLLEEALELLNLDYLGGHGSRGSGKVRVNVVDIKSKTFGDQLITPTLWENLFLNLRNQN